MVCAGNPGNIVSFHAFETDEDVLQCIIQCVTHMKLPRDIWWRHDDAEGLFALIGILMEIATFFPKIIPGHFDVIR
mgnify:CR=1 FL=1